MPTVKEILRQSGFTAEQIEAMDSKAIEAFDTVNKSAESERAAAVAAQAKADADFKAAQEAVAKAEKDRQEAIAAREKAELTHRSNVEYYEQTIVPGLTGWDEEKARLEKERIQAAAEAAYYRTQIEGAKSAGYVPTDAPGYVAPKEPERGADGKYIAGGGGTPGSPQFMDPKELAARFSNTAGLLTDVSWKYQSLYGTPMPIPPSQLIAEADSQKMDLKSYAEKKFSFSNREQEMAAQRQREHEAKLTAEARAAEAAEWDSKMKAREAEFAAAEKKRAEQASSNPDMRMPAGSSKFADVKKAVEAGERPNPLKMTDAQRRAATSRAIHAEISEREGAVA